ncbi:hypothetical protein JB92DRAFT_2837001 [Gautieria morchelliformis]|nr:hypothetical protein JB92DRAFT_2837001 [Gautieria morchelliformis]
MPAPATTLVTPQTSTKRLNDDVYVFEENSDTESATVETRTQAVRCHTGNAVKLPSSDNDDNPDKYTIEVEQEPLIKVVNQRQKLVKKAPLRFGPLEFTLFTTWEDFLQAVAKACHVLKEDQAGKLSTTATLNSSSIHVPEEEIERNTTNYSSHHESPMTSGLKGGWSAIAANAQLGPG